MSRGIQLDRSRYPLVVMRAGAIYTQADWDQLMKGMTELVVSSPFGLINDTRGGQMPDALQRRSVAAMYTNHEGSVRKHFLASAIVGSSSLINGVLTAINWLKPPPHPVKVFLLEEEAEAWVLAHFTPEMRARVRESSLAKAGER